jgi:2-amino-4-hydroxy-6-hydroxymethyldihydropteridine diphosphokinase
MSEVFLGLGSNLGDRAGLLERAVAALACLGGLTRSRWYENPAVGLPGAPAFLNGVVRLETALAPDELLRQTREIERGLGRDPLRRAGSRTIDIDILLYGRQVISRPGLEIPHPRLHQRAFVLVPLAELAPSLVHPVLGRTVAEMLADVGSTGMTKCFGDSPRAGTVPVP